MLNNIKQGKCNSIRSGDQVYVITGKDKGKVGKVISIIADTNRAIISGINIVTRSTKGTKSSPGGLIKKEASVHLSNVSLFDPIKKMPSKVGKKFLDGGKKVRFYKLSGEVVKND